MPPRVISSYGLFLDQYPHLKDDGSVRSTALRKYFMNGGVISAGKTEKGWPRIIYPTPLRIKSQIKELSELKNTYSRKSSDWAKELNDARVYHLKHNVMKLADPLYWKHVAKYVADKDYKVDAEQVKLPAHLVSDPRWKPLVKMFVNDVGYRKQLVETVQHSIVYESDKRVGRYADQLQQLKTDISSKKILDIGKKLDSFDDEIKILREMLKWSQER